MRVGVPGAAPAGVDARAQVWMRKWVRAVVDAGMGVGVTRAGVDAGMGAGGGARMWMWVWVRAGVDAGMGARR